MTGLSSTEDFVGRLNQVDLFFYVKDLSLVRLYSDFIFRPNQIHTGSTSENTCSYSFVRSDFIENLILRLLVEYKFLQIGLQRFFSLLFRFFRFFG